MSSGNVVLAVAVATALIAGGYLAGQITASPHWTPKETANVTCYKWIENGSAQVSCPEVVGAGNPIVRIDVESCRNYTHKIDETAPCEVAE